MFGDLFANPAQDYKRLKEENRQSVERDEKYRRNKPKGLPVYLNIETTRQCNLTCRMCPFHGTPEAKRKYSVATGVMEKSNFKVIAEELFPHISTLSLSLSGEFTLTEYLPSIFKKLGRYGVRFDGFTNGMLLTKDISDQMMPHLECFTVSVDSSDSAVYEYVRRGARWGALVQNIEHLMAARERVQPDPRPRIDLQAVLMKSTIETLPDLVRTAKKMGFDLVKGVHLGVFTEDMIEESLLRHRELYNRKREEAVAIAREVKIQILLPPPLADTTKSLEQKGTPPEGCEFLWRRSFINYDGSVFACCAPRPPLVGNMTGWDGAFETIWRGGAYSELRRRIFTEDPHPSCVKCWIRGGDIPAGMEEEYLFQLGDKK